MNVENIFKNVHCMLCLRKTNALLWLIFFYNCVGFRVSTIIHYVHESYKNRVRTLGSRRLTG